MTKPLFCASCQAVKDQEFRVVSAELRATCECGRIVKFPAGLSAAEYRDLFAAHRQANEKHVPAVEPVDNSAETFSELDKI